MKDKYKTGIWILCIILFISGVFIAGRSIDNALDKHTLKVRAEYAAVCERYDMFFLGSGGLYNPKCYNLEDEILIEYEIVLVEGTYFIKK